MTIQSNSQPQNSIWTDENEARYLRLRVKTFYNGDYFERIVMPLLDLPPSARLLDVGCGYGGITFRLSDLRPDLHITGLDPETDALDSAAKTAEQNGWTNITFEQGDGYQLRYEDSSFDAVLCQTLLTHVREAEKVIREMARVLKTNGVFMAAEYANMGEPLFYSSVDSEKRDEAWIQEYIRLSRLRIQGKREIGRGDDELGIRVPYLATVAGLDVFDVRLNDRVLHVIPPYGHPKQQDYLELLKVGFAPDLDNSSLTRMIDTMRAAGGTEEEAAWLNNVEDEAAVRQAIEKHTLTRISAYLLFLTFARKS